MSDIKISRKRLRELESNESILRALEGAGVDNWEGYEIAMERIEKENERIIYLEETVEDILTIASENADLNPAGPGTGCGFHSEAEDILYELLNSFIVKYNKL